MPPKRRTAAPVTRSNNPEHRAEALLKGLGLYKVPVPVERVAAGLGLQVERADLDDVSGLLVIEDDKGMIGVNASHPQVRQRFTIAHEVGHYVLHRDQLPVFIDKKLRQYAAVFRDAESSTGENRREREANGFAAALLMPAKLLQQEIDRLEVDADDEESVDSLARRFNVSRDAMSFRLANVMSGY